MGKLSIFGKGLLKAIDFDLLPVTVADVDLPPVGVLSRADWERATAGWNPLWRDVTRRREIEAAWARYAGQRWCPPGEWLTEWRELGRAAGGRAHG